MPHTGDLPNTVFSTAHSAITIEPFNYLPGDPSRATTQQVRINSSQGGNGSVTNFGAKPVTCSVDSVRIFPCILRFLNSRGLLADISPNRRLSSTPRSRSRMGRLLSISFRTTGHGPTALGRSSFLLFILEKRRDFTFEEIIISRNSAW